MQIQSGFSASLAGLQKASDGITQTSANIASDSLQKPAEQSASNNIGQNQAPSTVDNLTSLLEQRNLADANLKALQTSSDVLGNIIDIKA